MSVNQTIGPNNTQTNYLPPEVGFGSDEKMLKELLEKRERLTATIVNLKENAQYEKRELITGQQWFSATSGGAIKTTYTFRLTFDLVALNGGAIPVGSTSLTLSSSTLPSSINIPNSIQPVHGFGAANNGTSFYFINDPLVFVRTNVWTTGSQIITITNNTGASLTQCVWVMEYFKN